MIKSSVDELGHTLDWITLTCQECGLGMGEIYNRQKRCVAVDDGGAANEPEPAETEEERNARIWAAVQAAAQA